MNIDGNPSNSISGNVDNLEASDSIALTGKYVLPTDIPLANEIIQATNVVRPDGARLTQWQVIAGTGDVSSSTSSTVDNEIAVFNSTSGKIIKNSNTLVSALSRNPAIADLNMNNNDINNVSNINSLSSTIAGWITSTNGRLLYRSSDDAGDYVFREVGGSFSIRKFSDSLEPQIEFQRSRGDFSNQTPITNNQAIGRIFFTGNDSGVSPVQGALFNIRTTENWNLTSHGTEIEFKTANNGTTQLDTRLSIATDGVKISNSYYLPTTSPINNQILTANGTSSSTWSSNLNVGAVVSTSLQTNSVQTNSVQATSVIASSITSGSLQGTSLTIGSAPNNFIINQGRGNVGQYLQTDGVGGTSWQSIPESSYGSQTFNGNSTQTIISTQNNFVSVAGTRNAGLLEDFTSTSAGLTYTNLETKIFNVNLSISWALEDGKEDECQVAIFKNNSIVAGTLQRGKLDEEGKDHPRNVSTTATISLGTSDVLDIRVANASGTEDIIVSDFSFCISNISGVSSGTSTLSTQTLQQSFDLSSNPQIITTPTNSLTVRASGASEDTFVIENSSGVEMFAVNSDTTSRIKTLDVSGFSTLQSGLGLGNTTAGTIYRLPDDNVGMVEGDTLKYNATSGIFERTPAIVEKWSPTSALTKRTIENNALELRLTFFVSNLTIPANTIKAGDTFKIISTGRISATNTTDIATYKLKLGGALGTVVGGGSPFVLGVGNTLQYYKIETIITFRSIGVLGLNVSTTSYDYSGNLYGEFETSFIDTTVDQAWSSTWTWGTTGVDKIIEQEIWSAYQIV